MTKKVVVPNYDFLLEEKEVYPPLAAGEYQLTIEAIEPTTVKSGKHAGKAALNVKFRHSSKRVFWKLIPIFAIDASADDKTRTWFRMATVSFMNAFEPAIQTTALVINPESLVGEVVVADIAIQVNEGYGPQNVIRKFA